MSKHGQSDTNSKLPPSRDPPPVVSPPPQRVEEGAPPSLPPGKVPPPPPPPPQIDTLLIGTEHKTWEPTITRQQPSTEKKSE